MANEVHSDLFTALYLAALKKIVKDHPDTANTESKAFGTRIGTRMADNFFSKFNLYSTVDISRIEKYIAVFFKHYFNITLVIAAQGFTVNETWAVFSGPCGRHFICGLLNGIFSFLCPAALFYIDDERIVYKTNT